MFNLLKGKKRKAKYEKIRAIAKKQRGISLTDSQLDQLSESNLDDIIALSIISAATFQDMGIQYIDQEPEEVGEAYFADEARAAAQEEYASARAEYERPSRINQEFDTPAAEPAVSDSGSSDSDSGSSSDD